MQKIPEQQADEENSPSIPMARKMIMRCCSIHAIIAVLGCVIFMLFIKMFSDWWSSVNIWGNLNQQLQSFLNIINKQPVADDEALTLKVVPLYSNFILSLGHFYRMNNISSLIKVGCDDQQGSKKQVQVERIISVDSIEKVQKVQNNFQWMEYSFDSFEDNNSFDIVSKIAWDLPLEGVTILWKNIENFDPTHYNKFIDSFSRRGFHEDQIVSLNLSPRMKTIVLIFTREKRLPRGAQFSFKKPTRNLLAIQTEFLVHQNLPFIREWIGYHLNLGVDKFFIYDNNGSKGQDNKSTVNKNKYGFEFKCFGLTLPEVVQQFDAIWEQYYEHIVYIPWQPTNNNSEIVYGQMEGLFNYRKYFIHVTKYTAFIDLDEIIFSLQNLNLEKYLQEKSEQNIHAVKLVQKKFVARFCYDRTKLMNMDLAYEVNARGWAEKTIFQNAYFYPGRSIHRGVVLKGLYYYPPISEWRLNHYNLFTNMIKGSQKQFHAKSSELHLDSSLQRYEPVIKEICRGGKCEMMVWLCKQTKQKLCPVLGKKYSLDK